MSVEQAFQEFPEELRPRLLELRELVLETAAEFGSVTETLKWGQPSYLVDKGSTVRLGLSKSADYALFFTCSTNLVERFKAAHDDALKYEGNRAIIFHRDDELPKERLKDCLVEAFTYHRKKANTCAG